MILFKAEASVVSSISKFRKSLLSIDCEDSNSSTESTISTSLIHNIASEGKSEQFLNLTFQYKIDEWRGEFFKLKLRYLLFLLSSHRILWYFHWQKIWLTTFFQTSALVSCSQFVLHFSRQVSLHFLALEPQLQHLESQSEEFLDEVSVLNRTQDVDCQKTFPGVPDKFHVSNNMLLSRLSIERGLEMTAG